MTDLLTPEKVLKKFHELRAQVTDVINDGESLATEIPEIKAAAHDDFQGARDAISEKTLSLVILGAEGAGKSTLVRGLLNDELTPIENNMPGTVAPVYLRYGPGEEPSFVVKFLDGRPPEVCSKDQCFDYIRQRTNKNNKMKVARAEIAVNNRLLSYGLELVDMPGIGGVSDRIHIDTQKFIKDHAAAVIGVVDKRAYGPLIEIARNLCGGEHGASFQAIVSNRPMDFFQCDGVTKPDDAIARDIDVAKTDGVEVVAEAIEKLPAKDKRTIDKPTTDDLFVLSAIVLFNRIGPTATAAHLAEMDRFLNKIARYVEENGLGYAVARSVSKAEEALGRLATFIEIRRRLLTGFLGGDQELLEKFGNDARAAVAQDWVNHALSQERLEEIALTAWQEFHSILTQSSTGTINRIDRVIRDIRRLPKDATRESVLEFVTALCEENSQSVMTANAALEQIYERILKDLTASANRVLERSVEAVPMLNEYSAVAVQLSRSDVLRSDAGPVDAASSRNVIIYGGTAAGVTAGAAIGAKGAALMLVPEPITFTIGALLCGVGMGIAAWQWLISVAETPRDAAVRELEQMRIKFRDGASDREQEVHNDINDRINAITALVDAALSSRLEQIAALIKNPESERPRIKAEIERLAILGESVNGLAKRLQAIREEAHGISTQRAV